MVSQKVVESYEALTFVKYITEFKIKWILKFASLYTQFEKTDLMVDAQRRNVILENAIYVR